MSSWQGCGFAAGVLRGAQISTNGHYINLVQGKLRGAVLLDYSLAFQVRGIISRVFIWCWRKDMLGSPGAWGESNIHGNEVWQRV